MGSLAMHSCATLLALVLLPVAALAGSAEEPELTDAAGDQEVTRGPLVLPTEEDAFADIDLLAAWIETGHEGRPVFMVQTSAPPRAGAEFLLVFRIDEGPTSFWHSTASGTEVMLELRVEETLPEATFQMGTAAGAVGGDLLTIESVTSERTDNGPEEVPVSEDDQRGADEAGPGEPFTMPRPPVDAQVSLTFADEVQSGDPIVMEAPLEFTVQVTNDGTDMDTFSFDGDGSVPEAVRLVPGESTDVSWRLPDVVTEPQNVTLTATSARGAEGNLTLRLLPPTTAREPLPANLSPLTPLAATLGFDVVFEELAELALLAVGVLLAVLVLYWSTDVKRRPAPLGPSEERRPAGDVLTAATRDLRGEEAEPRPEIERPRPEIERPRPEPERPRPETERPRLDSLPARPSGPSLSGRIDDIRRRVDTLGRRPGTSKRLVVRVEDIQHDPEDPGPGDMVRTTARVRNGGDEIARLRIVVLMDDREVQEDVVTLGPGQVRPIELTWTARASGDVRLQVYDAG